jgi:hypothetical protein
MFRSRLDSVITDDGVRVTESALEPWVSGWSGGENRHERTSLRRDIYPRVTAGIGLTGFRDVLKGMSVADQEPIPAGVPMIDFAAHRVRAREGAPHDFEAMIAQLVGCLYEDIRQIDGRGGDWGIDVLRGDLNGKITIWQAKYFLSEMSPGQLKQQVLPSLDTAIRRASDHGYEIDEWILCAPCSLRSNVLQAWQDETGKRSAQHGIRIGLWDETELRKHLARPEAAHVRELYFNPYRAVPETLKPATLLLRPPQQSRTSWRPGDRHLLGGTEVVIGEPVEELASSDGSWRLARAAGLMFDDRSTRRVRLNALTAVRPGDFRPHSSRNAVLAEQAELLASIAGRHGWPSVVGRHSDSSLDVLITAEPDGPTWAAFFGEGREQVDALLVPLAAKVLRSVCEGLASLHRQGWAHRMIGPDAVVLAGRQRRGVLADLGLAGFDRLADEGVDGFRAPEQTALAWGSVGTHTDVYQLAALFYRTCTGRPVSTGLPLRAGLPTFPASADEVVMSALAQDPLRRPPLAKLGGAMRAVHHGYHPVGVQ